MLPLVALQQNTSYSIHVFLKNMDFQEINMFNFFIHDSEGCAMICAQEITIFAKSDPSLMWIYSTLPHCLHPKQGLGENHQTMPLKKIKEIRCDNFDHTNFLLKLLKTTVMGKYFKLSHDMYGDSVIVNIAYREDVE